MKKENVPMTNAEKFARQSYTPVVFKHGVMTEQRIKSLSTPKRTQRKK